MEVCSQPGMASDGSGDVSNEMIKATPPIVGFE
jgi:hypothetical protein